MDKTAQTPRFSVIRPSSIMKTNKEGIESVQRRKRKTNAVSNRINLLAPKMKQNQPKPRTPKK